MPGHRRFGRDLRLHARQFFREALRQLTEAAKALAVLERPVDKAKPEAGTLREHLEQVEKQGGKRDHRLDAVKIPEGFRYLFDAFLRARGGASEGYAGMRLTWRDLEAFQAVSGISLDPFEVEAIMAMDEALRAEPKE